MSGEVFRPAHIVQCCLLCILRVIVWSRCLQYMTWMRAYLRLSPLHLEKHPRLVYSLVNMICLNCLAVKMRSPCSQVARSRSAPPNLYCPEPSSLLLSTGNLQTLRNGLILPSSWTVQHQGMNSLVVYRISAHPSSHPLCGNLTFHSFQLDSLKCRLLSDIPETLDRTSLEELVKLIDKCNVCLGNPDRGYIEMVESKKGHLMSKDKKDITSAIDKFSPLCYGDQQYTKTV